MYHFTLRNIIQSALHTVVIHVIYQGVIAANFSTSRQCKLDPYTHTKTTVKTRADIPLNRVKDATQVQYVSAIAQRLATSWAISAAEAASTLCYTINQRNQSTSSSSDEEQRHADNCLQLTADLSVNLLPYLDIQQSAPGWLCIQVSNVGLEIWLARLFETISPLLEGKTPPDMTEGTRFASTPTPFRDSTELFSVQHAIARCQSLLHLATIIEPDKSRYSASDQSSSTHRRNFLGLEAQESPQTGSIEQASAPEQQFIHDLVQTFDQVSILSMSSIESRSQYLKLAYRLSVAFQHFYAHFQIGSPAFKADPRRMHVWMHLIGLCVMVLRSLLIEGLSIAPCDEL